MIDKPLYQNPLSGGLHRIPENISMRRPNNPSSKPDFALPLTLEQADPNSLLSGFRPPTSGPGFISDMRDRTLQDPYSIGGAGQLGLARNDGSYTGAMFLNDESRPRSEEDIRNRYEQARAQAAEQRRNGFLGQVVLPGEQSFDQFKEFSGNSFFLKRNPNIPETAYSNYDLTDVGGFDNPTMDASMKGLPETNEPPMFATPGLPPQQEEIPGARDLIETIGTVKGPEDTLFGVANNPYNRVGQQLTGPNEDGNVLETLKNIEQGIASLGGNFGQNFNMNQSSNYGDFDNFGIGSFFPPYGGMYG